MGAKIDELKLLGAPSVETASLNIAEGNKNILAGPAQFLLVE